MTTPRPIPLFEQPWPEGEFRFFQLGFFVDDLIAAAERWSRVFGVGPFVVLPRIATECTYRGETSTPDVQVAVAQAGPVQIELVQQFCDTPSIYRELFPEAGNGLHQLCALTTCYDAKLEQYTALGYGVTGEIAARGHRVAYVDTVTDFGFYTEVVQSSPAFVDQLTRVAIQCRDWDGVDPVRILTRDGYRTP
jgi:hypothetical protein